MRHNDHLPPHFHAEYQGYEAMILIKDGSISDGELPKSAARIIKEWAILHNNELSANWDKAQAFMPLEVIKGADND